MQLNVSQSMKMGQHMKLAPRMIQSMEILQLPLVELEERIEQELSENVVLERQQPEAESRADEGERDQRDDRAEKDVNESELNAGDGADDFERLLDIASDWPEDNYTSGTRASSGRLDDLSDRAHDAMANAADKPQTLHDSLLEQFHYFDLTPAERAFGEYLINNLDANGRLQSTLAEVRQMSGQPLEMPEAEHVLSLVQKLDPAGVGARDLKECMLLQIDESTPLHDVLRSLIAGHLDDIMHNRLPQVQRQSGYSLDLIKDAIEQMSHLNLAPGRGFVSEVVRTIKPDLRLVHRAADGEDTSDDEPGEWVVELIEEYKPSLRISPRYRKMLQQNPDAQTKEFIRKKVESAKWLIESIEQRYDTLRKVAQSIVNRQSDFILKGPEHIVPLKMQQIADEVGVHVTTVSRAVDDKHLQTPRGVFPLRDFFGGGTTNAEGEEIAWDIIRLKLKEIVDAEDKAKPLSDEKLKAKLADEGYPLARRTVTKYREALNIPSSRQRREY